jgi:HK97 gp10 family phage protein
MARIIGVPKQLGGRVVSNVRILGVKEALVKLKLVSSTARLELGLLNAGAAKHMENLAKEYVPVITGNLRSSIHSAKLGPYNWEVIAASTEGTDPSGEGKNQKEYAGFVEFGTSKMAPRFFMNRAYQDTRAIAVADLKLIAARIERL